MIFLSFAFAIASSCTVSSEGYTGVPTHHFMSKLLQVCISCGMFWAAARCRRMPLAMCQKRWRVVPSFSAFRRQWKGRAGNKLLPEFPRYCPINTLIYPFNWLSMHFGFIDFCPYDRSLSSSFWRPAKSTYTSHRWRREAEGKEPLRKELLLELREGSLGSSLDE